MQLGNVALRCSSPQVTVVRFALPDLALNRTFNLSPVAVGGGPAASLPQSSQVAEFLEALEVQISDFIIPTTEFSRQCILEFFTTKEMLRSQLHGRFDAC